MKRFLCLLLTVAMLACLSGCMGGNSPEDVRGDITGESQNQTDNQTENQTDNQTENQTENQPGFSMGKTENNLYNNDFLGLQFRLPEGWVFYTDAQILELNNIVKDEVLDEEVVKQLENATIVYDMYASNQAEGSNVNVNMEKLSLLQIATLDIKKTLESQMDTIRSTYENVGYTDVNIAYQKVTVDGKEFDSLQSTAKIQGMDFYMVAFAFRKGNYLVSVTVGSLLTDKTADILSCFTVK